MSSQRFITLTPSSTEDDIKTYLGNPLNAVAKVVSDIVLVHNNIKDGPGVSGALPDGSNVVTFNHYKIVVRLMRTG
jgi:hypothetical protein